MIEFDDVDPAGDGTDEDLPQPPERRRRGSPRARRLVAVVAAVVVGGGIITYARLSAGPERPSAAKTSSAAPATPSGTSADGGLLIEHLGDRNGTQRNDVEVTLPARLVAPPCPRSSDGFAACVVHAGVPRSVAAAVRAHYPQAKGAVASTTTLRSSEPLSKPGLWSRSYRATIDRTKLSILVTRSEGDGEAFPVSLQTGQTLVTYRRYDTGLYRVEIVTRGPRRSPLPSTGLQALAADPRLTAS